jgi:hypothetical protein
VMLIPFATPAILRTMDMLQVYDGGRKSLFLGGKWPPNLSGNTYGQ